MLFKLFSRFQRPGFHYPTVAPLAEMYSAETRCFAFSQNLYRHVTTIHHTSRMSNGKCINLLSPPQDRDDDLAGGGCTMQYLPTIPGPRMWFKESVKYKKAPPKVGGYRVGGSLSSIVEASPCFGSFPRGN
jgi:hypothetical protein